MFSRQGKLDEAIVEFQRAVRLLPGDESSRLMLARALRKAGRSSQASALVDSAQLKSRREKDTSLAKAYNNEATALLENSQFEQAAERLRQSIRLDPTDPLARFNYGLALLLQNKLDDAVTQFDIALQTQPDDPDTHYYLGRALLAQERVREATRHLERAARLLPSDPYVHNTLAVALARTNQFSRAAAELHTACRLKADDALLGENLACVERRLQGCAPQLSKLRARPSNDDQK